MDFLEDYPALEPAQKDRFQQVVTRLLAGEVLSPGSPLKPDPDWRFAERFRELVDSYLRIGGWRFDIDLGLRLARAVHETGAQRVRFSKLESLLLCSLRLYYHELMRIAAEEERCEIAVGMLRERLVHAGKPAAQLSARVLAPALRRLARHSLVQVARGFEARDDETVVVTALVEKVLSADRIQEIEQKVKAYVTSRAATAAEADGEPEADGAEEEAGEGSEGDEESAETPQSPASAETSQNAEREGREGYEGTDGNEGRDGSEGGKGSEARGGNPGGDGNPGRDGSGGRA